VAAPLRARGARCHDIGGGDDPAPRAGGRERLHRRSASAVEKPHRAAGARRKEPARGEVSCYADVRIEGDGGSEETDIPSIAEVVTFSRE